MGFANSDEGDGSEKETSACVAADRRRTQRSNQFRLICSAKSRCRGRCSIRHGLIFFQILRLNFRTLPPSEISKVIQIIENKGEIEIAGESGKSENQACVQASMIGDDPEVKLEVRNERQVSSLCELHEMM
eukprot:763664-Hanusia_phi.AAC.9